MEAIVGAAGAMFEGDLTSGGLPSDTLSSFVAVVTGSNRGIGKAICSTLASHSSSESLVIYATSRSGDDLAIKLSNDNQVRYAKLDISSCSSIFNFIASTFKREHRINILINNAGININSDYSPFNATKTIDLNYRSTRQACELFLSEGKMSSTPGVRNVNVTSCASQLTKYSPAIVYQLRNAQMTFAELDAMVGNYLSAVKDGKEIENGWNHINASYSVSKSFLNAATFILARENPDVLINCCCPGWVHTDMGNKVGGGGKSSVDGAKILVRLAVEDIETISGKYWANGSVKDSSDGKVKDW